MPLLPLIYYIARWVTKNFPDSVWICILFGKRTICLTKRRREISTLRFFALSSTSLPSVALLFHSTTRKTTDHLNGQTYMCMYMYTYSDICSKGLRVGGWKDRQCDKMQYSLLVLILSIFSLHQFVFSLQY